MIKSDTFKAISELQLSRQSCSGGWPLPTERTWLPGARPASSCFPRSSHCPVWPQHDHPGACGRPPAAPVPVENLKGEGVMWDPSWGLSDALPATVVLPVPSMCGAVGSLGHVGVCAPTRVEQLLGRRCLQTMSGPSALTGVMGTYVLGSLPV